MAYLLDSGFLFGFIDETDKNNEQIGEILENIIEPIVLPVPAITEVAYFVSKYLGVVALANFLDETSQTDFVLETPTSEDYKRAADVLRKYNDANIDFVDALIMAIAERLKITKILTVDRRHFGMFRPAHCEAFEILP